MYKCWELLSEEHLVGVINREGELELNSNYFNWMAIDPLKNEECKNCSYLPCCGGGCAVISYEEGGSYAAKGCFKVKGTLENQVLKYIEEVISEE